MRNLLTLIAVLAAHVAMPTTAEASIEAGDTIHFQDGPGYGGGGEFKVGEKIGGTWYNDLFRTFCIETNEFIHFNTAYTTHSVIDAAILGGNGGQDTTRFGLTADTVSKETAWLFLEFTDGTLPGYDYANTGVGRATTATQLQHTLWRLEGESHNATNTTFYHDMVTNISNANFPGVDAMNAALNSVRVINPIVLNSDGTVASNHKQSVLYAIAMPEPATALVWSTLSLIGLVAYGRPRRVVRN